jgi:thioredoxin-dependent peroxiredoxin
MMTLYGKAPEFSLKDKTGKTHSLKSTHAAFTVVYFYPKDSTPGCTIEAEQFSKTIEEYKKKKIALFGISGGDEKTKKKFCDKHDLKIILLSDPDFRVSKAYGVYAEKSFMGRKYMGISRTTFILDDKKKIIKIFENVNPLGHAKEVLQHIQRTDKYQYQLAKRILQNKEK